MRTKALLLGAAVGAIGLATSMAQVYSVNIVGYVNVTIPHGFSIICNPLNATGGNTIANVMPTPPADITIYKYRNASSDYSENIYDSGFGEWSDAAMTVEPGEGLFVYNPSTAFTWTFVGEVATGTQSVPLARGFNLLSSKIPQAGLLQTDLGYPPSTGAVGDTVYKYVNTSSAYEEYAYDSGFQEWSPEPSINVGEGFFLLRGDTAPGQWTRTFNVN